MDTVHPRTAKILNTASAKVCRLHSKLTGIANSNLAFLTDSQCVQGKVVPAFVQEAFDKFETSLGAQC